MLLLDMLVAGHVSYLASASPITLIKGRLKLIRPAVTAAGNGLHRRQ